MPYIDNQDRNEYDELIFNLQQQLKEVPREKRKGAVNYVISRIILGAFYPKSYHEISDCISPEFAFFKELDQ
jgi:hypothetical protein